MDTVYLEAEEGKKHAFTWNPWLPEGSLERVPRTETLEFLGTRVNFSTKLQQANEERRQRCPSSSLPPPRRRHGRLATHGSSGSRPPAQLHTWGPAELFTQVLKGEPGRVDSPQVRRIGGPLPSPTAPLLVPLSSLKKKPLRASVAKDQNSSHLRQVPSDLLSKHGPVRDIGHPHSGIPC